MTNKLACAKVSNSVLSKKKVRVERGKWVTLSGNFEYEEKSRCKNRDLIGIAKELDLKVEVHKRIELAKAGVAEIKQEKKSVTYKLWNYFEKERKGNTSNYKREVDAQAHQYSSSNYKSEISEYIRLTRRV